MNFQGLAMLAAALNKSKAAPSKTPVTDDHKQQLEVHQIAQLLVQQACDAPRQRHEQQTSTSHAVKQPVPVAAANQAAVQHMPEASSLLSILHSLIAKSNTDSAPDTRQHIEQPADTSTAHKNAVRRLPAKPQTVPPAAPDIPPQAAQNPARAVAPTAPLILPAPLEELLNPSKPGVRPQQSSAATAAAVSAKPAQNPPASAAAAAQLALASTGLSQAAFQQIMLASAGFDSVRTTATAAAGFENVTPTPAAAAAMTAAPAKPVPAQSQLMVLERLVQLLVQACKQQQEQQQQLLDQQRLQQQQQDYATPKAAAHSAALFVGSKRGVAELSGQQELLVSQAKHRRLDAEQPRQHSQLGQHSMMEQHHLQQTNTLGVIAADAAGPSRDTVEKAASAGGGGATLAADRADHGIAGDISGLVAAAAAGAETDLGVAGDTSVPVAAAGAAGAGTAAGGTSKPPILQLPLGMQMTFLRASGYLPLSTACQQSQGKPSQLTYPASAGGTDISSTQHGGSTTGDTLKRDRTNGKCAKRKTPVAHPPGAAKKGSEAVRAAVKPAAVAQFVSSGGRMVGWEERTYSTGSDRHKVWEEHKLVVRSLHLALASQPAGLAAAQSATEIFQARSCIVCWRHRPVSGAWCCTRPSCYRVGAAATQAAAAAQEGDEALLRHNWAVVRQTVQTVIEETRVAAAATGDYQEAATEAAQVDAAAAAAASISPSSGSGDNSSTSKDHVLAAAAVDADCSHTADTEMADAAATRSAGWPDLVAAAGTGDMDANVTLAAGWQQAAAAAATVATVAAAAQPGSIAAAVGCGTCGGTGTAAELAVLADAALQDDMPPAAGSGPAAAIVATADAPGSAAVAPSEAAAAAAVGLGSPSSAGSLTHLARDIPTAVHSAAASEAAAAADGTASPAAAAAVAGSIVVRQEPPVSAATAAAKCVPDPSWVLPSREYKYPDLKRLWEEHQLHLKVLLLELEAYPEALATAQQTISRMFHRCCVRCFSEGEGKARVGNGSWLCATCVRMFGRAHSIPDHLGLHALTHRISVDPLYRPYSRP